MSDGYELPTHCLSCGCVLKGGATEHAADCPFRKMIEDLAHEWSEEFIRKTARDWMEENMSPSKRVN